MNTSTPNTFSTADEMVRTMCGSAHVDFASACRLKLWPPDFLKLSESDQKQLAEQASGTSPGLGMRSIVWLVTAAGVCVFMIGGILTSGSFSKGFFWLLIDDEGQVILVVLVALALLANYLVPRFTGIWPRADVVVICDGNIILLSKVEHDRKKGVFRCGLPRSYSLTSIKVDKLYFAPLSGAFKFAVGDEIAEVCSIRRPARYAADYRSTPLINLKEFKAKVVALALGHGSEASEGQ